MNPQYLYTQSNIKVRIPASTVVKVVVVGTIATYFAKNIVKVIDEGIDHAVKNYRESQGKNQNDETK
jgi:hypothetical protein